MRQSARESGIDSGMSTAERGLAPIVGLLALVMGVVGVLVGFGIIGPEGVADDVTDPAAGTTQGFLTDHFMNGANWLWPAIAAGILYWTLNRPPHRHGEMQGSLYHTVAYIMAVAAIIAGALAVLVGFNVIGDNSLLTDGWTWGLASIGLASLAAGAHAAPRPYAVADDDYILSVVESRVGGYPGAAPSQGTTRTERVTD
ncbi:MAG: hypothetical protein GEU80_13110 [Dehalococcoidia bacterium]|nr:hypothetical protein [Dehalococcoidia bacterium]